MKAYKVGGFDQREATTSELEYKPLHLQKALQNKRASCLRNLHKSICHRNRAHYCQIGTYILTSDQFYILLYAKIIIDKDINLTHFLFPLNCCSSALALGANALL